MITAYYNDSDARACEWIRELIRLGAITPGEVDNRDINDVNPSDIKGFDRVHWFAGLAAWDYALNESRWGDRPIWTASLPCQPFSGAGLGLGRSDPRDCLSRFIELVRECEPRACIGEQVERAIKFGWLDDLSSSMEMQGYAVGAVVLGAHSAAAPHIRQRLFWLAYARRPGLQGLGQYVDGARHESRRLRPDSSRSAPESRAACEWIKCSDGKERPIKSGLIPLVDGTPADLVRGGDTSRAINSENTLEARITRLKGYGNAIQVETAKLFIHSAMEILNYGLTPTI